MNPLNTAPRIHIANDELQCIVNANPLTLTDIELQILLSLGADVVTVNSQIVPVGPQSAKWVAWKIVHDTRILERQTAFIKYSSIAAGVAEVAALATAVVTLIQVIHTAH